MKSVPVWVYYSVLRVLMFAVPLGILLSMQIKWWIAALVAALIGFCLSYILLSKSRQAIARDLYAARHREKAPVAEDDASEDAAVDRATAQVEQREQAEQAEHSKQSAPSEREGRSE